MYVKFYTKLQNDFPPLTLCCTNRGCRLRKNCRSGQKGAVVLWCALFPAALLFLILHTFFPFNVLTRTHFEVCVDTISAGVSYSLLRLFKNEAMGLWCQTSKRSLWMKMVRDMSAS